MVRAVGLNNYQLRGDNGAVLPDLVHVARLKTANLPPAASAAPPPAGDSDGSDAEDDQDPGGEVRRTPSGEALADDEFEVDHILAHRTQGKQRQYLVRWLGYGPEHDSWEPERNISPALLRTFKATHQ